MTWWGADSLVKACSVSGRLGSYGKAWNGMVRRVIVGFGSSGMVMCGMVMCGMVMNGSWGQVRSVVVGLSW